MFGMPLNQITITLETIRYKLVTDFATQYPNARLAIIAILFSID